MNSKKVTLPGSARQPLGTRVGDQPNDESIEVSIILKPKARAVASQKGGASVSRESSRQNMAPIAMQSKKSNSLPKKTTLR